MKPTIKNINIPGLMINARVWGDEQGFPIFAMHGWLDNAATFDLLAPLLPNTHIVSVDLPGHGFSDHLPLCATYNNIDRALQMLQVADALGWQQFSIMGHSLGGIVGKIMAAVAPDRINHLALIDVFGMLTLSPDAIVHQLQKYRKSANLLSNKRAVYTTLEDAAQIRANINEQLKIKLPSARILAQGGIRKIPNGYTWTYDQRLRLPTAIMFSPSQAETILKSIQAKVCLIAASEGILIHDIHLDPRVKYIQHCEIHQLTGGHHIHLDDPAPVAEVLQKFFVL